MRAYVHWRRVSTADDPRAYLRRILVRCVLDAARRPSRREVPTECTVGGVAVDVSAAHAEADRLARALRAAGAAAAPVRRAPFRRGPRRAADRRAAGRLRGHGEEQHAPGHRGAAEGVGGQRRAGRAAGGEDDVSATEEQVVALLRDVVAHGPDGSGLSVDARRADGTTAGRRRSGRRRWARWPRPYRSGGGRGGRAAGSGRSGRPRRPERERHGRADTEPRAAALRRVRRGAITRAGAPGARHRSGRCSRTCGWGSPGEFQDFPGSRSLQNFGTTGSRSTSRPSSSTRRQCSARRTTCAVPTWRTASGCTTSSPGEGLTLVRLLDRPDGALVGVELWHPTGVVVVSRHDDAAGKPDHATSSCSTLAQDPALRW